MSQKLREVRNVLRGRDGAVLLVATHHQLQVIGKPGRPKRLQALLQTLKIVAGISNRAPKSVAPQRGETITRHRWINEDAIVRVRAEAIRERELALAEVGDAGAKIKQSLKTLEIQQNRIIDAIAASGHNDKLLERLAQLGAHAQELKAELAALNVAVVPDPAEISAKIEAKIREFAAGIEGLLSGASAPNLLEFRRNVRGMIEGISVSRHESGAAEVTVRGQFAGVLQAAGLAEKHALKTKTPPEPKAAGGE